MHFNIKPLLTKTEEWNNHDQVTYKRLYLALKYLITSSSIPNNTKLPPSRILAKDLNLSRSTVLKAFEVLIFERFISSKKGSGYYVSYTSIKQEKEKGLAKKDLKYPKISKRAKLFLKNKYINTDNFTRNNVAFRPGLPPLDIFPIEKWKQLSTLYWRNATPTNLSYAPSEGLDTLRFSIANHLKLYRNISCDYNQIIITTGSLHSLYLIGNTLINSGDNIVMENPTFPRGYKLFKSLKTNIIPCNLDNEGLQIDSIKSSAKFIYTTPSNQYPMGIRMSERRRLELLSWVSKNNSLIIEDDYDHEFSNWNNHIPSLFSLDNESRVIYTGTFNKLLHPSIRIGYMIVPKYLINPIKSIYEQSSRFVPSSTQKILNSFIVKDYLNKHIRNVIETSQRRKNLFIQSTKKVLSIENHYEGLHIIGKLKNNLGDNEVHKQLLKNNVVAFPLSKYYLTKHKEDGLVLGYSSVNEKVMKEKIDSIIHVLNNT